MLAHTPSETEVQGTIHQVIIPNLIKAASDIDEFRRLNSLSESCYRETHWIGLERCLEDYEGSFRQIYQGKILMMIDFNIKIEQGRQSKERQCAAI